MKLPISPEFAEFLIYFCLFLIGYLVGTMIIDYFRERRNGNKHKWR